MKDDGGCKRNNRVLPLSGCEPHLAHFYDGSLADVVLEGQQQLVVGLLDPGSLHAGHVGPPLPGHS